LGFAQSDTEPEPPQIGAVAEILKESSAAEPLPLTTIYEHERIVGSVADVYTNPQFPRAAMIVPLSARAFDARTRPDMDMVASFIFIESWCLF